MKPIAFATFKELPMLEPDDWEVLTNLNRLGIKSESVIWNDQTINWQIYSVVIIRSCWDYHLHTQEFLNWINSLAKLNVKVINHPDIIRWNIYKTYLYKLQEKGTLIIPTVWYKKGEQINFQDLLQSKKWNEAVIKPVISLGSYNTWRSSDFSLAENQSKIANLLKTDDMMIQEFQEEVIRNGEYSFIYLNKKYQFSIVKKPFKNEFRVQEEYGGSKEPTVLADSIIKQANEIIEKINSKLLYARVDAVIKNNKLYLMELELIDPSLYLTVYPNGVELFTQAIIDYLKI